jgi:hypothetical protein
MDAARGCVLARTASEASDRRKEAADRRLSLPGDEGVEAITGTTTLEAVLRSLLARA